jgi:hypothetical protein
MMSALRKRISPRIGAGVERYRGWGDEATCAGSGGMVSARLLLLAAANAASRSISPKTYELTLLEKVLELLGLFGEVL